MHARTTPRKGKKMTRDINGFKLEVTYADLVSHVRISMKDGTVLLDTDKLSVNGLERLTEVVGTAASIALKNLPGTWRG
jgi:hypothetical protein